MNGEPEQRARVPAVPWTVSDLVKAILLFLAILLAAACAALLLRVIGAREELTTSPYAPGVTLIGLEAALIVPVWAFAIRKYRASWNTLGFRSFDAARAIAQIGFYLFASFLANGVWAAFLSRFGLRAQPNILPFFGGGITGLALAWFAAGVVAPLVEEIFFRGFVFAALNRYFGTWRAVLGSAAIFAVAHFTPTAVAPLFVLGLFLAALYAQTGSIWPSVLMHGMVNTLAVFALFAFEKATLR